MILDKHRPLVPEVSAVEFNGRTLRFWVGDNGTLYVDVICNDTEDDTGFSTTNSSAPANLAIDEFMGLVFGGVRKNSVPSFVAKNGGTWTFAYNA